MGTLGKALSSTVGRKIVMAVTGVALSLFLVAHLAGNLLILSGRESFNAYAQGLQNLGPLLWVARAGLLIFFLWHIATALNLTGRNKAARKSEYAQRHWMKTTFMQRYMTFSGIALLVFVIYHLLHFTFGVVGAPGYGELDAAGRHDVYSMVVSSFQNPAIVAVYLVAMSAVALHLMHGLRSFFQSLGVNHPKYNGLMAKFGPGLAAALVVGFSLIPLTITFGMVSA